MVYLNEQTDEINLFESLIIDVIFNQKDETITFLVDWTENETPITVRCHYCSNCIFNICSTDNFVCTGLLITGFSYEKIDDYYIVQFNFDLNMKGFIKFKCYGFSFEVPSTPIQTGGNDKRI